MAFFLLAIFSFHVVVTVPLTIPELKVSPETQIKAVQDLIGRVLGDKHIDLFDLQITKDFEEESTLFQLFGEKGKICITAADGVGLSSGLYHYLQHFTNSSVEWETRYISDSFPQLPATKIARKALVKYRYFFNVVAFGYTCTNWKFDEWERLIDWMALHGINLPLSFTGQEIVWMKTFQQFGISEEEMFDYISGPLFLPWFRKWGGPVSTNFLETQAALQKQILQRQRSLGMRPVLPAFSGFIPEAFIKKYPNCSYSRLPKWSHFNETFSANLLLDPTDELFAQLGASFLRNLIDEFGTDHIYNSDTFNENCPKSSDPKYLSAVSDAVYKSMAQVDKDATWMLQGWLFYNERKFWGSEQIEAYLNPVPNDRMIILDLFSDEYPVYKIKGYFGKPFIWCMLKNFGGRRGLYGNYPLITTSPLVDVHLPTQTMEGLGITSEAIYMPPFIYEVLSELYVTEKPWSESDRLEYARRYVRNKYAYILPGIEEAWVDHLVPYPYGTYPTEHSDHAYHLSCVDSFPTFEMDFIHNSSIVTHVARAFELFCQDLGKLPHYTDGFAYDFVDLTRQYLSDIFSEIYLIYVGLHTSLDHHQKTVYSHAMLGVLDDLDEILLTSRHFLLGKWIQDSRDLGHDDDERNLFEMNARNLLTLWGPTGEINDYAKKQWSGLVKDYYRRRWEIFFKHANSEQKWNDTAYKEEQVKFELFWQTDFHTKFPVHARGHFAEVGKKVFEKYSFESSEQGYEVRKDCDVVGQGSEYVVVVTRNVGTLAFLCNLDDKCLGFNSQGVLKKSVEDVKVQPGTDLYVKKSML